MRAAKVAGGDQHHDDGGDQQLVGDGVQEAAERGYLTPSARDLAVEPVREAGCNIEAEGTPAREVALQVEQGDDNRNGRNTAERQQVRQARELALAALAALVTLPALVTLAALVTLIETGHGAHLARTPPVPTEPACPPWGPGWRCGRAAQEAKPHVECDLLRRGAVPRRRADRYR